MTQKYAYAVSYEKALALLQSRYPMLKVYNGVMALYNFKFKNLMLDKRAGNKPVSLRDSTKCVLKNLCSRNILDGCHIYEENFKDIKVNSC